MRLCRFLVVIFATMSTQALAFDCLIRIATGLPGCFTPGKPKLAEFDLVIFTENKSAQDPESKLKYSIGYGPLVEKEISTLNYGTVYHFADFVEYSDMELAIGQAIPAKIVMGKSSTTCSAIVQSIPCKEGSDAEHTTSIEYFTVQRPMLHFRNVSDSLSK